MKVLIEETKPIESSLVKHYLPLYSGSASCGLFGIADDFVDDYLSLDEKFIKNKVASFFVRAQGDSMAPTILPGDILIVDRSIKIFNSAVATFFFNDVAICKQYIRNENQVLLRSFDPKVKDIKITNEDKLELFGVVTGLARNFY